MGEVAITTLVEAHSILVPSRAYRNAEPGEPGSNAGYNKYGVGLGVVAVFSVGLSGVSLSPEAGRDALPPMGAHSDRKRLGRVSAHYHDAQDKEVGGAPSERGD